MKRYFLFLFFFLAISLFHAQTIEQLVDLIEFEKDSLSKLLSQCEIEISDLNTSLESEIEPKEKSNIIALKPINDKYKEIKIEFEQRLKKELDKSKSYDHEISSNVDDFNTKSKEFESLYGEKKSISLILKHIYPYPDSKTIFNKINNNCCNDFKIDRNAQIKYYELLNTFDLLYKKVTD